MRGRGYHLIFAGAILALFALVLWWSTFMRSSIVQLHELHHESMVRSAGYFALAIGHNPATKPIPGELVLDSRLFITKRADHQSKPLAEIAPYWQDYIIVINPTYNAELQDEFRRKTIMVTGESSTLLLVVMVCVFMLWRMMRMEKRSHRELNEFWSRVTHEIKTPITGIKAFLQTLQQRDFSREEMQPLLTLALREVERQEMLAENLLMGQRMENRNVVLKPRAIPLAEFVRGFIDEHRMILPDEKLRFELECNENTCAMADPGGLRVILENLTDNALKYGGNDPLITYSISATGDLMGLAVSDHGMGFEPGQEEVIFEAYHRLTAEQPRGKHGTGMGMHLSRQLARKMGGDLTAYSEGVGKGSSFIVTLKKAQEQHG